MLPLILFILFILLTVILTLIQDLYCCLTKSFNNYIVPRLIETNLINIPFVDEKFFNDIQNLLLSRGFEKQSKYQFEIEKDNEGYLEHYVNINKGMLAVISQISIAHTLHDDDKKNIRTTKKILVFYVASYFDDQTHIITTSNPDYLDTRENVIRFSYPLITPEEILQQHEKNIMQFSEGRNLDYDILKSSFMEINKRNEKELTNHLVVKKIVKYNVKKEGYYLTLRGYFKFKLSQIKYFISINKNDPFRKNDKSIKYHVTSKEVITKPPAQYNFWLKFIVASLGIFISLAGIKNIYQGSKSNNWPKTKGEIISFTIDDDFDSIDAEIVYKYVVDGKTYTSNKTSFGDISTKNDAEIQRLYEKYKEPGTIIDVYYDPNDPYHAILEKGNNFFSFWPLIMGAIILLFCIPNPSNTN